MKNLNEDLKSFNFACEEIINGKYILIDLKLKKLIDVILNSESLLNIVNQCLKTYDFDSNFNMMLSKYFATNPILPERDNEIVAFSFSIIQKICEKEIDFHDFVARFFTNIEHTSENEFTCFITKIILPFQKSINNFFKNLIVENAKSEMENSIYLSLIDKIHFITSQIDTYHLNQLEKDEFITLLNSLYLSCKNNDKKFVYSFMIGIDYFTKCHKKSRSAYNILKETFER